VACYIPRGTVGPECSVTCGLTCKVARMFACRLQAGRIARVEACVNIAGIPACDKACDKACIARILTRVIACDKITCNPLARTFACLPAGTIARITGKYTRLACRSTSSTGDPHRIDLVGNCGVRS
jgi:hypothetical protein